MKNSIYFILEITVFLILILFGCLLLYPTLEHAFNANIVINGGIIAVLLIGIFLVYKTMYDLMAAQKWTAEFRQSEDRDGKAPAVKISEKGADKTPRLIRPTATLLSQRTKEIGFLQLNSTGMRAILEGLSIRIDETRETLRYVVALLVFLGLLGTFWGLMQTVQAVSGVIDGLSTTGGGAGGNNITGSFEILKEGLKTPLNGMGTAFSSSLFGLAGSLLLGYCTLRVSQAQNRFYQDYEEWLSSLTRLSGATVGEGDTAGMGLALSLLEQTADSIDRLQLIIGKSEGHQAQLYSHIGELNQRLGTLVDSQKIEHELMRKLAEGQLSTRQLLERMSEADHGNSSGGLNNTSLKPIEQILHNLVSELREGREQSVKAIKDELRIVSRTISNSLSTKTSPANLPPPSRLSEALQNQQSNPNIDYRTPPSLKSPYRAQSLDNPKKNNDDSEQS